MTPVLQRLRQLLLPLMLGLCVLLAVHPVRAEAGPDLNTATTAELQASLEQARDPQRLADLQALQQAIAASDDRAQLSNQTSHNIGVFARYKKDVPDTPGQFYVLGPGHQTDDDYDVIGLLVPSQVTLTWGDAGESRSASVSRVLRVLEGEQLEVSEPASADPSADAVIYQLSLPAFSVETSLASIAALPAMTQEQLDQGLETAPLD